MYSAVISSLLAISMIYSASSAHLHQKSGSNPINDFYDDLGLLAVGKSSDSDSLLSYFSDISFKYCIGVAKDQECMQKKRSLTRYFMSEFASKFKIFEHENIAFKGLGVDAESIEFIVQIRAELSSGCQFVNYETVSVSMDKVGKIKSLVIEESISQFNEKNCGESKADTPSSKGSKRRLLGLWSRIRDWLNQPNWGQTTTTTTTTTAPSRPTFCVNDVDFVQSEEDGHYYPAPADIIDFQELFYDDDSSEAWLLVGAASKWDYYYCDAGSPEQCSLWGLVDTANKVSVAVSQGAC